MRLAIALIVLCASLALAGTAGRPVVAVVTTNRTGPFGTAMDAMIGALGRLSPAPELLLFDVDGGPGAAAAAFTTMRRAEPALIVTVGTIATTTTLAEAWPVPIVFSMVLYPEQSDITQRPGRDLTGVALDVPFEAQFRTLRRLLPDAHSIGVLYRPDTTAGVVAAARTAAPRHGFTLDAEAATDPAAAVAAIGRLLGRVDTVLAIADHRIYNAQTTSALILESLRQRKPLLALAPAQVRAGALASLGCDYSDIGLQTAALIRRLLGGEKPAAIPIEPPRKLLLTLNRRVAAHLGVAIPGEMLSEAAEVVE